MASFLPHWVNKAKFSSDECDQGLFYLLASVSGDGQAVGHQAGCFVLLHQPHGHNGDGHLRAEKNRHLSERMWDSDEETYRWDETVVRGRKRPTPRPTSTTTTPKAQLSRPATGLVSGRNVWNAAAIRSLWSLRCSLSRKRGGKRQNEQHQRPAHDRPAGVSESESQVWFLITGSSNQNIQPPFRKSMSVRLCVATTGKLLALATFSNGKA